MVNHRLPVVLSKAEVEALLAAPSRRAPIQEEARLRTAIEAGADWHQKSGNPGDDVPGGAAGLGGLQAGP